MILNSEIPYLTIDKESGILLRFFNIPSDQSFINRKYDIVAIPVKKGNEFVYEKRHIIESINDNTVIVDKAFTDYENLPAFIFDFKNI